MQQNKKKKSFFMPLLFVSFVWGILVIACFIMPPKESSQSERRKLAQFPTLSTETVRNGSFMSKFETYTLDQFPLRDSFRKVKAITQRYGFGKKDNNGYYIVNGYIAKLDFPFNQSSLSHGLNLMQEVYSKYLSSGKHNILVSVVPDKGYYLANENGYPSMDYQALLAKVKKETPYAAYVDITDQLAIEDYYKTDTHWKQECLVPVADKLKNAMGIPLTESKYQKVLATDSFYGVYAGQSAYPVKPDKLYYLNNNVLEACRVTNLEDDNNNTIYNLDRVKGKDPYDVFLSGATPFISIENPNARTKKELIVFRDSFGSSLAPLLAEDYSKITLVDMRYINSSLLGQYLDFNDQDVLFLYSTLLLNESFSMR